LAIAGTINNHAGLIWSIADLLRGDYKRSEYGRVTLFTSISRFSAQTPSIGSEAQSASSITAASNCRRQTVVVANGETDPPDNGRVRPEGMFCAQEHECSCRRSSL
jgi:hypothetical protein